MAISIELLAEEERGTCPRDLAFGNAFSDHMFSQKYVAGPRVGRILRSVPFSDLTLHPAAAVLHYGQEIFEGLKAYRRPDGGINLFRPQANIARFNRSAERMVMPQVDADLHLEAIRQLVAVDSRWVPEQEGASYYIRPTMIATTPKTRPGGGGRLPAFRDRRTGGTLFQGRLQPGLGVHFRCLPAGGGRRRGGGPRPAVTMPPACLSERKWLGRGFTQVLWLDAIEGRYVEEVGAMNICFAYSDGSIATPALSGSILAGITRDSVLRLAPDLGHPVREDRLDVEQVLSDIETGRITEVFRLRYGGGHIAGGPPAIPGPRLTSSTTIGSGPVAERLYRELTSIQYGLAEDRYEWIVRVDS